jgi:3-isopropylmalate/(R)-2-methylmalate dehydratase small subunit
MKAVRRVEGTVCPLNRADVDTDQIIPKQFLKRVERTGFGPFAFFNWRYDDDGNPVEDFPMNRPEHEHASVLVAGANFGCGSSREHAVWALEDAGFEAVVAPSFADIFRNNCAKVGVLTVELTQEEVRHLLELVDDDPSVRVFIDLEEQTLVAGDLQAGFEVDPSVRHRLLNGLDDIGITLQHGEAIDAYEQRRPDWMPHAEVS